MFKDFLHDLKVTAFIKKYDEIKEITMSINSPNGLSSTALKNVIFAIGMMVFLAICFKITAQNDASTTPTLSQTDVVMSTLREPEPSPIN